MTEPARPPADDAAALRTTRPAAESRPASDPPAPRPSRVTGRDAVRAASHTRRCHPGAPPLGTAPGWGPTGWVRPRRLRPAVPGLQRADLDAAGLGPAARPGPRCAARLGPAAQLAPGVPYGWGPPSSGPGAPYGWPVRRRPVPGRRRDGVRRRPGPERRPGGARRRGMAPGWGGTPGRSVAPPTDDQRRPPKRVEAVPGTPFGVVHLDVAPVTSGLGHRGAGGGDRLGPGLAAGDLLRSGLQERRRGLGLRSVRRCWVCWPAVRRSSSGCSAGGRSAGRPRPRRSSSPAAGWRWPGSAAARRGDCSACWAWVWPCFSH